jgi:hypothetical protein
MVLFLFICIIINKNKMKNLIKFILSLFKVNKKYLRKLIQLNHVTLMYLSKVLALINEYRKPINLPELR